MIVESLRYIEYRCAEMFGWDRVERALPGSRSIEIHLTEDSPERLAVESFGQSLLECDSFFRRGEGWLVLIRCHGKPLILPICRGKPSSLLPSEAISIFIFCLSFVRSSPAASSPSPRSAIPRLTNARFTLHWLRFVSWGASCGI